MLTGIAVDKRQKAAIERLPLLRLLFCLPALLALPLHALASIAGSYFYAACQCVTKTVAQPTYLYTHVCVCECIGHCVFILHDHGYDF